MDSQSELISDGLISDELLFPFCTFVINTPTVLAGM